MYFSNLFHRLNSTIASSFGIRNWQEKLLLVSLLVIVIVSAPFFNFKYFNTPNWDAIEFQAKNFPELVTPHSNSHTEKMTFRLFVPLLAKILHLSRIGLFAGQVLCGILFIYFFIRLTYIYTEDRIATVLYIVAASNCYFFICAFYDVFGRPDIYPLLLLLIPLLYPNRFVIFLGCFCAAWCDERALLNSGWLFLFFVSGNRDQPLRLLNDKSLSIAFAAISYLSIRMLLISFLHLSVNRADVGWETAVGNAKYISISMFTSYSGLWIFLPLAVFILIANRQYWLIILIAIQFLASLAVSILVQDIHRSLSYLFPSLLLFLRLTRPYLATQHIRILLYFILTINLLTPIIIWDGAFHYLPNLAVRISEYFVLHN